MLRQGNVFTPVSHSVHRGRGCLADTPPGRHPPSWADTPSPRWHPPPPRRPLQRTVRILLECILVQQKFWKLQDLGRHIHLYSWRSLPSWKFWIRHWSLPIIVFHCIGFSKNSSQTNCLPQLLHTLGLKSTHILRPPPRRNCGPATVKPSTFLPSLFMLSLIRSRSCYRHGLTNMPFSLPAWNTSKLCSMYASGPSVKLDRFLF